MKWYNSHLDYLCCYQNTLYFKNSLWCATLYDDTNSHIPNIDVNEHIKAIGCRQFSLNNYRIKSNKTKTICVGHHYAQANTNNVNKTWAPIQTTGGKDDICIHVIKVSIKLSRELFYFLELVMRVVTYESIFLWTSLKIPMG
jgi:hypothetical protein